MAKEKPQQSNLSYIGINNGMFIESHNVTQETAGAEKIIITNPETQQESTKWVVKYRSLSGYITGIDYSEKEHQGKTFKQLVVMLYDPDEDETTLIQTGFNTAYAGNFICRLPMVDFSKEVKLTSYSSEREDKPGKFNNGISIRHREGLDWAKDPIKSYYTKDNPNGSPQLSDKGIDGDIDVWKVMYSKFLKKYIEEEVPGKIVDKPWGTSSSSSSTAPPMPEEHQEPDFEANEEDLPF